MTKTSTLVNGGMIRSHAFWKIVATRGGKNLLGKKRGCAGVGKKRTTVSELQGSAFRVHFATVLFLKEQASRGWITEKEASKRKVTWPFEALLLFSKNSPVNAGKKKKEGN